jgi:hypothetical protein
VELLLALRVPGGVTASGMPQRLTLSPGERRVFEPELRQRYGAPGSLYRVVAVADAVIDGRHHSVSASAMTGTAAEPRALRRLRRPLAVAAAVLAAVFVLMQHPGMRRRPARVRPRLLRAEHALVLAACLVVLAHVPLRLVFADTMTVGGDTPAHHYLAGHLRETLLGQGRIVSWAGGWWCGFPMFRFYFCLPYLLVVLLDLLVPFNIAFKLVSLAGAVLLPLAAWKAGRLLRLPAPAPALMAVFTLPLLFDRGHTMWGVNLYSTLSGMIANSLSFTIMLPAVAAAWRDSDEGRFRPGTVLLLTAVVASHFFTALLTALTLPLYPLLRPRRGAARSLCVLAAEGGLAVVLMAWWLVPLAARRAYAVDFGGNWDVDAWKTLPAIVRWGWPLCAAALVLGLRRRLAAVAVPLWTLLLACALFVWGQALLPVFVNVRLWPFIVHGLLTLAAIGLGLLLQGRRGAGVASAAVLAVVLLTGIGQPNDVRNWARWNYEGLERKPAWPAFRDLVLPLRGTPGRLANDLHAANNVLGSSRIFEAVPHLVGKPVLEGGLVNTAVGSLFSYYVQSETSEAPAGLPRRVRPARFDPATATRHLDLFNVKHVIARGAALRRALGASPDWASRRVRGEWELFELLTHDGRYVGVPRLEPVAARAADRQQAGLDWLYRPALLGQLCILLDPGDPPPVEPAARVLDPPRFRRWLQGDPAAVPPVRVEAGDGAGSVQEETVTDTRIRFRTTAVGRPHLVKCTYDPNWKVRGARRVYRVTPAFMLVYPTQPEVELYYGWTAPDVTGRVLTGAGWLVLAAWIWRRARLCRQDRPG